MEGVDKSTASELHERSGSEEGEKCILLVGRKEKYSCEGQ